MKLDGARLVTERNKKGKLQAEVAGALSLRPETLSKAENSGSVSRNTAVAICDYYGLDLSEMVMPEESKGDAA